MRLALHALLPLIAIFTLTGCGSDKPPEPLTKPQAESLIQEYSGDAVSCKKLASNPFVEGPEQLGYQVWLCKGGSSAGCWEVRYDEDEPYAVDPETADLAGLLDGCGTRVVDAEEPTTRNSGPEKDLAAIELRFRPDGNHPVLDRIGSLLDILEAECPSNTRRQLADFTANAYKRLNDAGIEATPTEILQDVQMSSELRAVSDCLDLFAYYVSLREGGG